MRIQQSQIALDSERVAYSHSRTEESLRASFNRGKNTVQIDLQSRRESERLEVETYNQFGRFGTRPAAVHAAQPSAAARGLGQAFQPLVLNNLPVRAAPVAPPARTEPVSAEAALLSPEDAELALLRLLIEWMSGHEIDLAQVDAPQAGSAPAAGGGAVPAPVPGPQFSVDYSFSSYYYESEQTSFHASGTVATADGREIAFDLSIEMARSFESFTSVEFHAGQRKDPLLLDFSGAGPELSSARYGFDLDGNGKNEQIAMATGASAFLALDLDGDGKIGSGRELFGAQSGDGFADLARYDDDGNGFIDAGDAVFSRLLAYRKDEGGKDRLDTLASLGVGALYLGSASTPFELRTADNTAQGAVRRTGLYLNEDGSSGALQQLDLVV